jgi:hypothetical protein
MTSEEFFQELDARIAPFDLLCHPFYKAWSAGELSRADLREYARDYFHHVSAFPTYLAELSVRLEESELRRAVLSNLADEKGCDDATGNNREHAELWLDFAEGMGASRDLRPWTPRDVRRRRQNLRIFHPAQHRGCLPRAGLAATTGATPGTKPAGRRIRPRGSRERSDGFVEGVGRNRGTPI